MKWLLGGFTALMLVVVGLALMLGAAVEEQTDCTPTGPTIPASYMGAGLAGLDKNQTAVAVAIVTQGRQMRISDRGLIVALATASQESTFQIYANDGKGSDLKPDQRGIEASLALPHDAVGSDHGSLGPFQQQWPWWGTMEDLMSPAISARKFFDALLAVQGWETMPVTVAAQRVQRSAFPDAYADDEQLAVTLLGQIDASSNGGSAAQVAPAAAGGDPYGLGNVKPRLRALVHTLAPMFDIKNVGGYRTSAKDPNGHPSGNAADFMVPMSPAGQKQGNALAKYGQMNAAALGIDYMIWNQRIWSTTRAKEGWRPMEDRGNATENHYDHVHINVVDDANAATSGEGGGVVPAVATSAGTLDPDCVQLAVAGGGGTVVYPVADAPSHDKKNWGMTGGRWSRGHTGTDFSIGCGTPVVASHGGTVIVETDQGWAGQWLVKVQTEPGGLTSWYAHMQSIDVANGAQVAAGTQVGAVGSEGNSTGCHLHFEIHTRGEGIYSSDNTNPTTWLEQNVGQVDPHSPGVANVPAAAGGPAPGLFRIAAWNVLGHNHTIPGGNKANLPDSSVRTKQQVGVLESSGVTVAGLQEFQPQQEKAFLGATGGRWALYPAAKAGHVDNRVAWQVAVWEVVKVRMFTVPYFRGNPANQAAVLLRHRATGRPYWVLSVHNPANVAGAAEKYRRRAVEIEAKLMLELGAGGVPVLLTGDMNETKSFYCQIRREAGAIAANGGQMQPCRPPEKMDVDWIVGSSNVAFRGYSATRSPALSQMTDHPLILADVAL